MNVKRIFSMAMAGAMTLGVALSNGVSTYAAPEDWFSFGVDCSGAAQPSVISDVVLFPESYTLNSWVISYGYTLHDGYKYVVQVPYDGTGYYLDDGTGDGYAYRVVFDYTDSPEYGAAAVDFELQFTKAGAEYTLTEYTGTSIPAGTQLAIYTGYDASGADMSAAQLFYATSSMLVYDQANRLVDSFKLSDINTVPATPVPATPVPPVQVPAAPAPTTPIPTVQVPAAPVPTTPVPSVQVPAAPVPTTPVPSVQVPVTPSPEITVPADSDALEAIAREVLRNVNGAWGVGKERKYKLEAAGYDYKEVQKKIYEIMMRSNATA